MIDSNNTEQLNKWRLMLGRYADQKISFSAGAKDFREIDNVLDFLYSREYGEDEGVRVPSQLGGNSDSNLTISKGDH